MSNHSETKYACDKCRKRLPTHSNHVAIGTTLSDESIGWSRLRVVIEHRHGSHNNGKVNRADLCKKCVIALLTDALNRVKKGERVSAGIDTIDMLKFNQTF